MLTVNGLSLHFGDRALFDNVDLFIGRNDRVALAGRNGQGKSTMLKLLAREIRADEGTIEHPKDLSIGYLPQTMKHDLGSTAREVAMKAYEEASRIHANLEEAEAMLQRTDDPAESMAAAEIIAHSHDRLNALGAGDHDKQVELDLMGIGFSPEEMDRPLRELSGGWRMRAELTRILLTRPDLLMLDEPTNHLDLPAIQWLEDLLANWSGAFILISHDKVFLDRLTERTVEVNNGKLIDRKVPWSQYVELRKVEREQQAQAAKDQQKYVEKTQQLINKFRAKKDKAAFAQSLITKLEKMDRIQVDDDDSRAFLVRFPPAPRAGKIIAELKGVSKSYEEKRIVENVDLIIARGEHLALVGANGTGKTTMLRIIIGEESCEGEVTLGHNVILGYYAQDMPERLDPTQTVLATAEQAASEEHRTKVRAMLGAFLFSGGDVDKFVSVLSGGERARLALCCMLLRPLNFLILDEPTHHLDIPSKEVLKQALKAYDGTFLLVSHDRDFLHGLTDRLLELEGGRMRDQHYDILELIALKKNMADQVVPHSRNGSKKGTSRSSKGDHHQKKQQEKEIRKLTKKIKQAEEELARLEGEQADLNTELVAKASDAEFQRKGYERSILISQAIEDVMEEWESAGSKLEQLQNGS